MARVPDPAANNGFNATADGPTSSGTGSPAAPILGGPGAAPARSRSRPTWSRSSCRIRRSRRRPSPTRPATARTAGATLTYGELAERVRPGHRAAAVLRQHQHRQRRPERAPGAGGKMISYHGLADTLIPPPGSINYYTRVANLDGGFAAARRPSTGCSWCRAWVIAAGSERCRERPAEPGRRRQQRAACRRRASCSRR